MKLSWMHRTYNPYHFGSRRRVYRKKKEVVPTLITILRRTVSESKLEELFEKDPTLFNLVGITNTQWKRLLKDYYANEHIFGEFCKYFKILENKTQARDLFRTYPSLFNDLPLEVIKKGALNAKETLWILMHILKKNEKFVINEELLDWVQEQVFIDVLADKSKSTFVVQKNLEKIKKLQEKYANNK